MRQVALWELLTAEARPRQGGSAVASGLERWGPIRIARAGWSDFASDRAGGLPWKGMFTVTKPYSGTEEKAETIPEVGRMEVLRRRVDRTRRRLDRATDRLDRVVRSSSLRLLRLSLGVIFIWFGALKVAGITPVKELVAETMPWLDAGWFVPALGWFEIVLGLALMVGYRLGWVCAAMVAHLAGTFLTVVMEPSAMFQHGNPFMLTMEGEFVAKNLVLITAALVIASWSRRPLGRHPHTSRAPAEVDAEAEAEAALATSD